MMDQKERYRQHASLCYEIAANISGERAASMTRLGDTYAALAVDADQPLNAFIPASKYAEPLCAKCGKDMKVTHTLPRTDIMPAMQAFRCDTCGETMIWKGKHRNGPAAANGDKPAEGRRLVAQYIAASFRGGRPDLAPGPAVECPDAKTAILRAELLAGEPMIVGAVAFSRHFDSATGKYETAVILKAFGKLPKEFDIA
jgi:DNA-directed RNA polymerase subunit RPC12/RpoP